METDMEWTADDDAGEGTSSESTDVPFDYKKHTIEFYNNDGISYFIILFVFQFIKA